VSYPPARRQKEVDFVHGREVPDPYRWLEDPSSSEAAEWSDAQDELARAYLDSLPGREAIQSRLRELFAAGLVTVPVVRGERAFYQRRTGEQEHSVLLVREADGTERVLVDPAALSDEGIVTLDGWAPSIEGSSLIYLLSEGGDEESVLRVMDVLTGEVVDGPIDRTRYSSVAWLPGGEAFYFVRRLPPGSVPPGEDQFHRRVYRHVVGTDPDRDELVFGEGRDKTEYYDVHVSRDGRWMLVWASLGTAPRNDLYIADLASDRRLRPIQEGVDALTAGQVKDGRLYLLTNRDAPRFRLVVADPERPESEWWRDLVPESDLVLTDFTVTRDAVVVAATQHAIGTLAVHDLETGALRRTVDLPGLGTVMGLSSRPEGGDDVWIGYSDFTTPPRVYRYVVESGDLEVWEDAPGAVEVKGISASQVWYRSKDGTDVPMFLIHREGLRPDMERPSPTILYGYGGFNISQNPEYSARVLSWVDAGGIFAIACLRGGSEEGETWHRAGMREAKQNVFDDFVAAAEWLIERGYTSPVSLGIYGGSNGGLLVGAALTQRPDLFEAVVCSAPLLDMIRYERFGLGVTWNDEYGTVEDATEFGWLLAYSPYHRVVEGAPYPAVLFTVFESDTRVDPLHARKMCAALQWATTSDRPILIRRERKVGHGARSLTREVDLSVDRMAFFAALLGLRISSR
jgi:prolyl oligopeptidase